MYLIQIVNKAIAKAATELDAKPTPYTLSKYLAREGLGKVVLSPSQCAELQQGRRNPREHIVELLQVAGEPLIPGLVFAHVDSVLRGKTASQEERAAWQVIERQVAAQHNITVNWR
jgi:hypothetical protein